jgi:methionyl-tRNA synthetase
MSQVEQLRLNEALGNIMGCVNKINSYLEETAPWSLAKQKGRQTEVNNVLYTAAESLRIASVLLWPVMPERMSELWARLGWSPSGSLRDGLRWGGLDIGAPVTAGPPLFSKDIIQERLEQVPA